MKFRMALSACALSIIALASAVPASADVYRFDVTDPDSTLGGQPFSPYHFFLDSSLVIPAGSFTAGSFSVDGTTYGHTFSDVAVLDTYTFYTSASGGGFDDFENVYESSNDPAVSLFTGSTSAPTFKLGTFALDDFEVPVTLTISDISAPAGVPEPVTLSLFCAGLVGAGAISRRRNKNKA